MDDLHKIAEFRIGKLLDYAENHPDFNADFVKSMAAKLGEGQRLTPKMLQAIANVYDGFIRDNPGYGG